MDRYQVEMIARGPTLAGDGATPTGLPMEEVRVCR
jgi:hypothetical protein